MMPEPGTRCQILTTKAFYDPCTIVSCSKDNVVVEWTRQHHDEHGKPFLVKHSEVVPTRDIRRLRTYQPDCRDLG